MSAVEDAESPLQPGVEPLLPLALLESLKAHDRPSEILEDEDLTTSLPRRLGLTGVVETQIIRYEEARRRRRTVTFQEFHNLLKLVLRRPDAEAILNEAGQRIARRTFAQMPAPMRTLLGVAPARLRFAIARRAATRALRRIAHPARVETAGKPFVVRVSDAPLTSIEPPGLCCAIYSGLLQEALSLYGGRSVVMTHSRCSAQGEKWCEWKSLEK